MSSRLTISETMAALLLICASGHAQCFPFLSAPTVTWTGCVGGSNQFTTQVSINSFYDCWTGWPPLVSIAYQPASLAGCPSSLAGNPAYWLANGQAWFSLAWLSDCSSSLPPMITSFQLPAVTYPPGTIVNLYYVVMLYYGTTAEYRCCAPAGSFVVPGSAPPANQAILLSQPGGPGTALSIANTGLTPGHEYYNIFSTNLCPGGPGTGPFAGLCFPDPSFLIAQIMLPAGALPFHFIAASSTENLGAYILPAGLSFEVRNADVSAGCLSSAVRYTIL